MRFKMFLPNYYEKMMAAMWRELWERSGKVNRTTIFLRLARELGIPFKTIDHLLMHTEDRTTTLELHAYNKYLIEEERVSVLSYLILIFYRIPVVFRVYIYIWACIFWRMSEKPFEGPA